MNHKPFITTNLDVAAYLCAIGHGLANTERQGRFVAFLFDRSAARDVEEFGNGAQAPAKAILESYRALRTIITHEKERGQNNYVQYNQQS
jgi:hypothetical protein